MTADLLGIPELRAEFERIIAANPDAKNPVERVGGVYSCLYTLGDRHCIVGQVASDLGWPLPDDNRPADVVAFELGWPVEPDAGRFLTAVQALADGPNDAVGPTRWGSIDLNAVEVEAS